MAKKNKIPTLYLFIGGTLLFSLAWLMPSFPLLTFIGLAPFMAIVANNPRENSLWNYLELVLLGFAISFFCAIFFDPAHLIKAIILSILLTTPFLGYAFARNVLGEKASLITLILYWLTIEYILLFLYPTHAIFLADIMNLKSEWLRWTAVTGYLGTTLWILCCNYLFYKALLTNDKASWIFIVLFLLVLITPIGYSYSSDWSPITREQMLAAYVGPTVVDEGYPQKGEFIPRTATWISVLILLFTFVKKKTNRKK